MPLTSDQLPNLMNGVSQQAVALRMKSQAEAQVNGYSSIVEGVGKRPPTKHVKRLTASTPSNAFVHLINRDATERYNVIGHNNTIEVYDLAGVQKTVAFPDGAGYVATADPRADLDAVTIADHTFIVNRSVTADKLSAVSASNSSEAIAFIKSINYAVRYAITIDGVEQAAFKADKVNDSDPQLSVAEATADLAADLTTNLGAGWTITDRSPIVHVQKDDGTPFTMEVTDTLSNTASVVITDKVQRFTELPITGKDGYIVEVTGDDSSAFDNYFLKFVPNNAGQTFDEGVWEETVAPGIEHSLDPATMPHELVRMPDGSFELRQVAWGSRTVGDLETAPWPSFVGSKINGIYFDRNRLCFLSDDNVIMSRAREFFEFFPETVVTLLDDGPIDVSAGGTKVSILRHAALFANRVVLFADQTQFVMDDANLLASAPPTLDVATSYESDLAAAPVTTGSRLFFTAKSGSHTAVHEYFVIPDTTTFDASNTTRHVPRYVPSSVFDLAVSTSSDVLIALSADAPNKAYVYKYMWRGQEKVQSSWSQWEFSTGAEVLGVSFVDNTAYVVVKYSDGVHLETIDLSEGVVDTDATFVYRIDRRVDETAVTGLSYDTGTQNTSFTMPYTPDASALRVVARHGAGNDKTPATTLDIVSVVGDVVTVRGDLSSSLFYVGQRYVFSYTFTQPVLKSQSAGGSSIQVMAGRLQVNRWHVAYANTGYFRAEVTVQGRPTYTYAFTGKLLGTSSAVLGEVTPSDGIHSFRVNGNAKTVTVTLINDSFLPSSFTGAEWEGRFERKTSRL